MGTNLFSFNPTGPTVTFTAATSAPTAVQAISPGFSGSQVRVINSGGVLVFLGWGTSASSAATNSGAVATSLPLLPGTDEILTFPRNAYFTGITSSGTSVVYITPGEGN